MSASTPVTSPASGAGLPAPGPAASGSRARLVSQLQMSAVPIAFVLMVVFFSLARPEAFPTMQNWTTMLELASPLAVVAFGVTVPLAVGDFDLSIGGVMSLCSAVSVVLMAQNGVNWMLAVAIGVLLGGLIGAANGYVVSYLGASSFVITLAAGQMLDGGQLLVIDQSTIFAGIPEPFLELTRGFKVVVIAALVAVVLSLFLSRTVGGRNVYAVGINPTAARFAGLRVRWWRLMSFLVVGASAAIAGILLASRSAAESPGMGTSYLLPAYAAAFLGSAVGTPGKFTIMGTALGVVFLQVMETGLAMMNLPGPSILIIEGGVLAGAILFARLGKSTS